MKSLFFEYMKIQKLFRITRRTKQFVWIIPSYYGFNPPKNCSRKIPIEEFKNNYSLMPQNKVKIDLYYKREVSENS